MPFVPRSRLASVTATFEKPKIDFCSERLIRNTHPPVRTIASASGHGSFKMAMFAARFAASPVVQYSA